MGDRYSSSGRGSRCQKIKTDGSFCFKKFSIKCWLMYIIQFPSSTASSRLQKLFTVNQMVEASIPQVYWTGYESLILVSAHFIAKWGVNVSKDPMSSLFPRRWLDIKGNKVSSFWHAALRSVMGSVIFRPGISQVNNILNTLTFYFIL